MDDEYKEHTEAVTKARDLILDTFKLNKVEEYVGLGAIFQIMAYSLYMVSEEKADQIIEDLKKQIAVFKENL